MQTTMHASDLEAFRAEVTMFLEASKAEGTACEAFGAILPPHLHAEALRWQAHLAVSGFAGLHWPVEHGGVGLNTAHSAGGSSEIQRNIIGERLLGLPRQPAPMKD